MPQAVVRLLELLIPRSSAITAGSTSDFQRRQPPGSLLTISASTEAIRTPGLCRDPRGRNVRHTAAGDAVPDPQPRH